MKLINKICVFLTLASYSFLSLEAKSIEILLDHQTEKIFHLSNEIPELKQELPFSQSSLAQYCKSLKIENIGNKPLRSFFPHNRQASLLYLLTTESENSEAIDSLISLYQLWEHSIIQDDSVVDCTLHPIDLLKFNGICSKSCFNQQFIKLCNSLGIETRLANVQGREAYDFGVDGEWIFFDLDQRQYYLELDNEKLASSENVMDDPFLILRNKHSRQAKSFDFAKNWQQVSAFDILNPISAAPVVAELPELSKSTNAFELYPGEVLRFDNSNSNPELALHACALEHTIDLSARDISEEWKYHSFFPVHQLTNHSDTVITLVHQKVQLQPGETYTFKKDKFKIRLKSDAPPQGKIVVSGKGSWALFPSLVKGKNHLHLAINKNDSRILFHYEVDENLEGNSIPCVEVKNDQSSFDFVSPSFKLEFAGHQAEQIWWQISLDDHFEIVPTSLEQVEPYTTTVTLPLISETFFSPGNTYYFRAKVLSRGKWSTWSNSYEFTVNKPAAVEEVIFEEVDAHEYELNWERYAEEQDESLEYLIFGSNAFDFIPSIYADKQVNAIVGDQVTEDEINDNLVAVTNAPKIRVDGNLAYYRIIARQKGQYSVPSRLIQVYDHNLIQPRTVLQMVIEVEDDSQFMAKRTLFPSHYPWTKIALPTFKVQGGKVLPVVTLQSLLRSTKVIDKRTYAYEYPKVSDEIWEEVTPYLLPENHPAWPKLNRVFCKTRATQNSDQFKKAGFRRWRPGRWSRVSASGHPEFPEYFIKAYCDTELGIIYDWRKWIHRIHGAECIRECIKSNQLQANFKVPHKWIYPLPKNPSPPNDANHVRKNFILVCENMRIEEHDTNEKLYKNKFDQKLMDGLYTILQVCGLYDSVYVFNMPFCKDGKIAIIDTEYHHKWPVPFQKLNSKFSSKMQAYWQKITFKSGKIPDGVSLPNPPRMDRRDVRR